jgi:hypothetical protein
MEWAGHVAYMDEMRKVCKILVRKPAGKGLGRLGLTWEENIRKHLKE